MRGVIKINLDAAVGWANLFPCLVVVAKDWRGDLIFTCLNKANTNSPFQVEVEALRWVISLAD